MVNANGDEVPAINFDGACYELELIKAAVAQSIEKSCNVDKLFSNYVTRINKVCRGTANCALVPMDKDLLLTWRTLQKPSARKCFQGFALLSRSCLGLQWCKTDMAKADLRCFVQESLYVLFTMASKKGIGQGLEANSQSRSMSHCRKLCSPAS